VERDKTDSNFPPLQLGSLIANVQTNERPFQSTLWWKRDTYRAVHLHSCHRTVSSTTFTKPASTILQ